MFQTSSPTPALPSLSDTGFLALQSGNLLAVEAIARALARKQARPGMPHVSDQAIAALESVFG